MSSTPCMYVHHPVGQCQSQSSRCPKTGVCNDTSPVRAGSLRPWQAASKCFGNRRVRLVPLEVRMACTCGLILSRSSRQRLQAGRPKHSHLGPSAVRWQTAARAGRQAAATQREKARASPQHCLSRLDHHCPAPLQTAARVGGCWPLRRRHRPPCAVARWMPG